MIKKNGRNQRFENKMVFNHVVDLRKLVYN